MKVGEQVQMIDCQCEVIHVTEQGFVLEPIVKPNSTHLEPFRKKERFKTKKRTNIFIKLGQFIDFYI